MSDLTFGSCFYSDQKKDVLQADGTSVGLRRQTVEVFKFLAEHPDTALSRDDIQSTVWPDQVVTNDSLSQCISEIRKSLGDRDRKILKTIPRRGYMLIPDESVADLITATDTLPKKKSTTSWYLRRESLLTLAALAVVVGGGATMWLSGQDVPTNNTASYKVPSAQFDAPSVAVDVNDSASDFVKSVAKNTRISLSRYRSVSVVNDAYADLTIRLTEVEPGNAKNISLELETTENNELIFAEKLQQESDVDKELNVSLAESFGKRIAGMIASPGGGAVSRHLLKASQNKPVEELSDAECFAYGYGCTNCSGELDTITDRATQCLESTLQRDPTNPRAWGLQSTIYARQYAWSSALPEPARTRLSDRSHLVQLAIDAANKAEQYSDGADSSVYWGMAQAYAAACQTDKLRTAVDRGLKINPEDPSLLGAFGSWLAYNGDWDRGVDLVHKALEIEPRFYKRWWLFAEAKNHYAKGDYEKALESFRKAYNERNWLSHLQMAYTLPHLDRTDEAIEERKALERLYPGVTIENVLQFYKTYCFDNSFLEKIKWALSAAGLPSRGQSDDLNNIQPPEARVINVNGFNLEYRDVGEGIPIVFIHGSISDYRAWSHYQNPISENHRFISYSLRYAGSQQWPDSGEKYGIATDAEDLIAFVEALETGPVFTASWSRGGRVSGLAALERPDLFQGNIHFEPIVGQLANTSDSDLLAKRDEFFARFDDSNREFEAGNIEKGSAIILENVFELERGTFPSLIMPLRAMNRDAARNMALQLATENKKELDCELLMKTTVPTLVAIGAKTNAWWSHLVYRFHECVPDSEFITMEGVNHDGPIRDPEKLTDHILSFVSRNTPSD